MKFNLRGVDLNLLPVFEAAYEERSLSKAANRLGMTQPAVSHALGRLRHLLGESLFIRNPRGMEPTPVADQIYIKLHNALDDIRALVIESGAFDPLATSRKFVIAIPHPLGPILALNILKYFAFAAPGFEIEFKTVSRPSNLLREIREGAVDIAIDWIPVEERGFSIRPLFLDGVVPMARADHPVFNRRITKAVFSQSEVISLRPRQSVGEFPAWFQLEDQVFVRVSLEVSEILEVLLIVSQSQMLGVMTESMAKLAESNFGVRQIEVPFWNKKTAPVNAIWHTRRNKDAAHSFLREGVVLVAQKLTPPK